MELTRHQERNESLRLGPSSQMWWVFRRYEVVGQVIRAVPAAKLRSSYMPVAYPRLPFELAKIQQGDVKEALRFVNEWGLLSPVGRKREDPPEFAFEGSLDSIWGHAHNIRAALDLRHALQENDSARLSALLETYALAADPLIASDPFGSPDPSVRCFEHDGEYWVGSAWAGFHSFDMQTDRDAPEAAELLRHRLATELIGLIISAGIKPIGHRMKGLEEFLTWRSLIDVVYWHLKTAVRNGPLQQCDECGGFFVQTDRRMKFCPPSEREVEQVKAGLQKRAQSKCALRHRAREWREVRARKGTTDAQ